MKNKLIKSIMLFLLILVIIIGCSRIYNSQVTELKYEDFKDIYLRFKTSYSSDEFISITPPEILGIVTTSFPDNQFDNRQADILDNSIEFPARYEMYFKSNTGNLLVKVNFIYSPENKTKKFLSINSISNLHNSNISEEYKHISRPLYDEYILTQNGYIVIINFFDNSNVNDDEYEKHLKSFIDKTLRFYKSFEDTLMEINEL